VTLRIGRTRYVMPTTHRCPEGHYTVVAQGSPARCRQCEEDRLRQQTREAVWGLGGMRRKEPE
jgi:hypothetical protein